MSSRKSKEGGGGARKTFLEKLYDILDTADPTIICWDKDGKVILINDKDRLSKEVLSKYFRSSQYESFVRQLSFYNFRRTGIERASTDHPGASGVEPIMEFMNDRFTRDNRALGLTIKRKTYGVDDVKEEMLEIKSEMAHIKDDVKSVRATVQQLGSQFEEMRRAMLQVLQNQQHLHQQQQKQEQQNNQLPNPSEVTTAPPAVGTKATSSPADSARGGPLTSPPTGTIPPKPFGSTGSGGSGVSLTSFNLGSGDGQQPSIGSFNLGSQTWNGSFNMDPSSPAVGAARGDEALDSEGLGQLFSTYFDDASLGEGQGVELLVPITGEASSNASAPSDPASGRGSRTQYRVPVQPNKRLRGRGASAIHDGPGAAAGAATMGPPSSRRIPIASGGGDVGDVGGNPGTVEEPLDGITEGTFNFDGNDFDNDDLNGGLF
eukprot:INCI8761.1.p1 GENE.INCI8761.1~~INCI8761.1.p1  ORF type:complete len:433 (+),score=77.52 INCI8761.1:144-1442(+)